jgi:hypothetical protein
MPDDDDGSNSLPDPQQPTSRADKLARVSEGANDYPYLVIDFDFDFGDGFRVIECAAAIQWVVQKRVSPIRWNGHYFCHTKESTAALFGAPDRSKPTGVARPFPGAGA